MTITRVPISPKIATALRVPSVVTWSRLEGRPRSADFERSLRAEVRDALWMLTRQWQIGELTATDGGTPVLVRVETETEYDATADDLPREAMVEREVPPIDVRTRIRLGARWLRSLHSAFGDDRYRALFVAAYPIAPSTEDATSAAWTRAMTGRCLDGEALLADLRVGAKAEAAVHEGLAVADADRARVAQAASDFAAACARDASVPADASTWVPERLEYRFEIGTKSDAGATSQLAASEYHGDGLDWHAFDVASHAAAATPATMSRTYLPAPVTFAGMPASRWWEVEDQALDLGAVDAHTTDLAKLLLLEFGLTYANDWGIVALPVRAGSLSRVVALVTRDVFGQETQVPPAHTDGSGWAMFELSGSERRSALYVPAAAALTRDGAPLETVEFRRDEMANLIWAVETTLPSPLGAGMRTVETMPTPSAAPAPGLHYQLMGSVPRHWIPFVPTRIPDSNREVQLERGAMLAKNGEPIAPRGEILVPSKEPYFIHEEEVGRVGVRIERVWRRARTSSGATITWLGRRRTAVAGEASSGLRFDDVT